MKPVKGFANGETEIWIKGRGFGKQGNFELSKHINYFISIC
jgi:hypothetical protein